MQSDLSLSCLHVMKRTSLGWNSSVVLFLFNFGVNFSLFAQIQSNVESLQREIRSMKTAVKIYVKHFKVEDYHYSILTCHSKDLLHWVV